MSKEATVFVIDISMEKDDLEVAKRTIVRILQHKILGARKGDQVDIVGVGGETSNRLCSDEEYQHISSYCYTKNALLLQPSMDMVRFVTDIKHDSRVGDVMDGIVIGIQTILEHIGNSVAYKERLMYVFTDGKNPVYQDFFDGVYSQLNSSDIRMVLCGYEFGEELNSNQKILKQFTDDDDSNHIFYSGLEAYEEVMKPLKRSVRPTTLFRGDLIIGQLKVPIWMYSKTMISKPLAAKKYSPFTNTGKGNVLISRTYVNAQDSEASESFDPNSLIKSYRYGKSLVPFAEDDELAAKLETEKAMVLLGFAKKDLIPRGHFISNIIAVTPDPGNSTAGTRLTALVAAMHDLDCVAIVRYCRILNSTPKIGALYSMPKGYCYFVQLPYVEDLKYYNLIDVSYLYQEHVPSKQFTSNNQGVISITDSRTSGFNEACAAIDKLVDLMDLEETNEFLPKTTYNMYNQFLIENVICRINGNPNILSKSNKQDFIRNAQILEAIKNVSKCFSLEKINNSKSSSADFWEKRRKEAALRKLDTSTSNLLETSVKSSISTLNPVGDFQDILLQKNKDIICKAIRTMFDIITTLVLESDGNPTNQKVTDCFKILRNACLEYGESDLFDGFYVQFQKDYASKQELLYLLRQNGIMLFKFPDNENPIENDTDLSQNDTYQALIDDIE